MKKLIPAPRLVNKTPIITKSRTLQLISSVKAIPIIGMNNKIRG
jgi:hypothetical protein